MQPIVELRHVTFGYDTQPVLEDVSLHLHRGQFAALVGPSGAGKTTVLRLILGILTPTRGEVSVGAGGSRGQGSPRVGYVPQLEAVD